MLFVVVVVVFVAAVVASFIANYSNTLKEETCHVRSVDTATSNVAIDTAILNHTTDVTLRLSCGLNQVKTPYKYFCEYLETLGG